MLVTIVSLVSSKPIDEQQPHNGEVYNSNHQYQRPKRQLPDEVTLNKQFFEDIFKASRISRDTSDGDVVPTIALHDLISSVEHTLIHSAQNLALSNITANSTTTNAEPDSNNTSNIEHIVLPISVPEPKPEELVTESEDLPSATEKDLIRDYRSNAESGSGDTESNYESVKPIEKSNLGILFPISLNPSANISHVVDTEESHEDVPVTEETNRADQANITVIHTINATEVVPTVSDVVHVQQQQITFFSANAGVFPNIHAIKAEDLPTVSSSTQSEDCSGEEISNESDEVTSSSEENSSSDSSSEEHKKAKKSLCTLKSSSKPTETSTPSTEATKKLKTDELKEKIAEVEADPVILTQGI